MAAQVRNDHTVSSGEMREYRLEHLAGDHQAMYEQEGRPDSKLSEVEELRGTHVSFRIIIWFMILRLSRALTQLPPFATQRFALLALGRGAVSSWEQKKTRSQKNA
jgi:hypothetical protein